VLHLPSRELQNGAGRTTLPEQPFQVLRLLLARPGGVVTREELRERLWPEGTFVDYEHSLNAAVKRLRAALGDDAKRPNFIETLPRRGYRWMPDAAPRAIRLAVLPFTVHDGHDAFGSGLAEELIAQLGHRGDGRVHVVSRRSALACTGDVRRASDVGASLGADYLLEGGVRQHGDRVRIAVWLVDTRDEIQMWSDVHECGMCDPVAAQIHVAGHVAQSVIEKCSQS